MAMARARAGGRGRGGVALGGLQHSAGPKRLVGQNNAEGRAGAKEFHKEKWSGLIRWVQPKMKKAPREILSNLLKINGLKIQRFKIFLNWIWTRENKDKFK
jgi:hypothetical protein